MCCVSTPPCVENTERDREFTYIGRGGGVWIWWFLSEVTLPLATSEKSWWLSGMKLLGGRREATAVYVCVGERKGQRRWCRRDNPWWFQCVCTCVWVCVCVCVSVSVAHTTVAGLRSISSSNFAICCMSLALKQMKSESERHRSNPTSQSVKSVWLNKATVDTEMAWGCQNVRNQSMLLATTWAQIVIVSVW